MDSLSSFFIGLSSRFGKENDLSDITLAMCMASPSFKEKWIHFFFPRLIIEEIEYIEREVPDDKNSGSRVDFYISMKNDSLPYLIEVKIWDQNHHFGQYEASYGVDSVRLGYITNYPLGRKGYTVKQWRQFYEELNKALRNDEIPDEEKGLVSGYNEYLKNVCSITMITEKIDLNKMTSLYDLTVIAREVSEYTCNDYVVKNYSTTHRDDLRWLFLEVDYTRISDWGRQYPFIGIIFRHPEPYICAGFDCRKGWAKGIVNFMYANRNLFNMVEKKYCSAPELAGDYYFYMSEEAKIEFREAENLEKQKAVLSAFINEVLLFPVRLLTIINKA